MATCWKCGREVSGLRAISLLPTCPECEQLEVLKGMNGKSEPDSGSTVTYDPEAEYPDWMRGVSGKDDNVAAAMWALFLGNFGAPFLYSETSKKLGMFLLIAGVLTMGLLPALLSPMNLILAIYYLCMDNEKYLRKYKPTLYRRRSKAAKCLREKRLHNIPLPETEPPDSGPAEEKVVLRIAKEE